MLAIAARGEAREGDWLVAAQQNAGRGRQGRVWLSPAGNLHASGLVTLFAAGPPAPTLALVAGIAACDALASFIVTAGQPSAAVGTAVHIDPSDSFKLKWPNDVLAGLAKVAGILLERQGDAVVIGVGINLAVHPDLPERPTTNLAALGIAVSVDVAIEALADAMAHWVGIWRSGLPAIRAAWLARAHPIGTPLSVAVPESGRIDGAFAGLTDDCALRLRLPGGAVRVIHVGDVVIL